MGYYQFVSANDNANNVATLTATLGCTPSIGLITTNGIVNGVLTITNQNQNLPLADGDWVHFVNLMIPVAADGSAPLLDVGPSYMVDNVFNTVDSTFQLIDGTTGQIGFTGVNASAASLVKEIAILRFEQQAQTVSGQSVTGTVVVTQSHHGLLPGDPIVFRDLNTSGGFFDTDQTYYVTGPYTDSTVTAGTGFFFAAQRGGVYTPPSTLTLGPGGRVTLPLGRMYGFDVGGDVTITASFNGGYQMGTWANPTDYSIGISGSLSMSYLQEKGTSISGTLSANGNSQTSVGLLLQSEKGNFTISAGAFDISGSLSVWDSETNQQKLGISMTGASGAMIASANGIDTWAFNGSLSATVPGWGWSGTANFGHGQVNGLTLLVDQQGNRFVQEFAVSIDAEQINPPTPPSTPSSQLSFSEQISLQGAQVSVDYNRDPNNPSDWSLLIAGSLTVAIGDSTPVAGGGWQPSVDTISLMASNGVELSQNGAKFLPGRYELDVNGPFSVKGKLNVVAQSLKFIYQSADPVTQTDEQILLSGGVVLPDLRNARIQFGNDGASGGLEVDLSDRTWKLNGWRISIPSFPAATLFQVQNFVLGFSKTTDASGNDDYEVQAGGQVQFFSGKLSGCNVGVQIKFDIDNKKLKIIDIGASLRNMNPGLLIPPVDGALTDIAFDVDGIPGSISADLLFGAVFGSKVTVGAKEYSMIQAIVSGAYKYRDISVTGTVLFAGGTLGQVTGTVDLNWGTSIYSVNLQGKFLYDAIEASAILYFANGLDYGLFSCKLQVPSGIPIIGGISVAEADAMYYVDHSAGGKKFLAAWFVFLGHWKYGLERDLVADAWKLIGTKAINGLTASIPGGTGANPNKYNLAYTPTVPSLEARQSRNLADNESSDSYGLMNVVWSSPDGSNDTIFIASGTNDAVQVYGPGATPDSNGWVNDPNGGVSYTVLTAQSGAGNVLIHVAPTASFTAPGASESDPDLYVSLPGAAINVVLTSNVAQSDDVVSTWTGSFSAAAPELQNVTLTQPQTVSALGDDVSDASNPDPVTADNATISFQWRGLDPDTTDVALYFDYNSSGYTGTNIATISGNDLTILPADGGNWQTVTVPWDIGGLDPARPVFVYAVIKDDGHAGAKSPYTAQVQSVPAAQIQVSYAGGTQVSSTELQDILLMVTPVQPVTISSITAGVVTVSDSTNVSVGDMFMFSGLTSPVGIGNATPYYVASISGNTFTFSNVAAGAPLNEVTASQGMAYIDQDVPTIYGTNASGLVWPQVDVNQPYRFAMAPPRSVFAAAPQSGQEVSNVGELIQYSTFVGNNQLLRMPYRFSVMAAIAGRVYNDFSANGQLDSIDTGLAGATVFLDDNNNGILDPGEDFVITGPDGNFLFVHQWADTDNPTTTYTTWPKVIPPTGWQVTSSPTIPSTGITFTNNGNEQATFSNYNFMIASPITVSGIVYDDLNNDGVRDSGDKGLPGVTINITPPAGAAVAVTTDSNGRWQITNDTRGAYSVSVELPSGGTFTTVNSTLLTTSAATNLTFPTNTPNETGPYVQTGLASQWNPVTAGYSAWLAALVPSQPQINFVNLAADPTGNATIVNDLAAAVYNLGTIASRFDAFLGMWSANGVPSLAVTYIVEGPGAYGHTYLAVTASGPMQMRYPSHGGWSSELYALSYDPTQPNYSTVASINSAGQAMLWKYFPAQLGLPTFAFRSTSLLFLLTGSAAIKIVGFNKAGSDHFQSQDLAVVSSNPDNTLKLTEWNHATTVLAAYPLGGQVFVDMIAGDFNGNGFEDIAVLTADTNLQQYYVNVLLSKSDGTSELVTYIGSYLAATTDGTPRTTLASIRVLGEQQALLWNTQSVDGSTRYINAAVVANSDIRVSSGPATVAGRIAALSAGNLDTPATFATYSIDLTETYNIPVATGTVQLAANGQMTVSGDLTQFGGSFSGFDIGISGVTPPASTVIGGIVYNDANSNGIQDPGESGLPGVTVRLVEPNNTMQTTITSDGTDGQPAGSYSFQSAPAGSYVQVLLPPGTWTAENPPPGISTNATTSDGIVVGVTFMGGETLETIGFTDGTDNNYTVIIKSADLQSTGRKNLVIRASSALFVQRFQSDGTSVFDTYNVGSPAAYYRPQLFLEDINADGRIDIVTSGQSGVDVYLNIGLGGFRPYLGQLAGILTNSPNGAYSAGYGFTDDLSSGVATSKKYTHALNLGSTTDISVNGVNFAAAPAVGTDYSLAAADPRDGATGEVALYDFSAVNLQGNFFTIAATSFYSPATANGTEQLTLSGLTPGVTYTTTFYTVGSGTTPRIQTVVDSLGGSLTFDANGGQSLNGYMIPRTFTATGGSIVFTFFPQDPNASCNLIALTNEVASVGYSIPFTFSDDDGLAIEGDPFYTHILAFAAASPITVAGLTFTPAGQAGPNWSLTGYDPDTQAPSPMGAVTGYKSNLTGNVYTLASDFFYTSVGGEQLTLTGLTVGATYTTTWYSVGYQAGVQRVTTITDSLGGQAVIDQNQFGAGNGIAFSRTFTAVNDTITFTFIAQQAAYGFQQFALTNQLVASGNYLTAQLTGDADSSIESDKTYTHILDWEAGSQPVTVDGVPFQGAARSGPNYSLVTINPHTLAESEIDYFLNFNNNVSGELNSAISNGYIGTTKLILSGLTPGTTYRTTFYAAGDGNPGARFQTISDSQAGCYHFDENIYGNGNGFLLMRTYIAASDAITIYIVGDNPQNPFLQGALTNEIVPLSQQSQLSPGVCGTEIAVLPATTSAPALFYAAQQNTQIIYELSWNTATATLASTGRVFPIDRLVTRMVAGSVAAEGEVDLVIFENSNTPLSDILSPNLTYLQKIWMFTPGNLYAVGEELVDFGVQKYAAEIDLQLAPLFSGVQTVVFLGINPSGVDWSDVVTYRTGSGANTTNLPGWVGYALATGAFEPGSSAPNILVSGGNSINVLSPGANPNDPGSLDPNLPLVVLGSQYTPYSWNASAVGASTATNSDDLIAVRFDQVAGFSIVPFFNITGAYQLTASSGGGLYDFPVVIPGSIGGTIRGNVFLDSTSTGKWDPSFYGVHNDITVYLDLNNNGQWDPNEPRAFPNTDGDYQFAQLPPQAYTVAIQVGTGYTLATGASASVTLPAVPGAQINGIDFGVKTGDFGADFNNDHQPDLLLTDPKDQSVHVQLRSKLNRVGTYKVGTLPSPDWVVAAIQSVTHAGAPGLFIQNLKTGELNVWEFYPGRSVPTVARAIKLDYTVPDGYQLLGIANLNVDGLHELILAHQSTGDCNAVALEGSSAQNKRNLPIPPGTSVVAVGDVNCDGYSDLLLRDTRTGHLLLYLLNPNKPETLKDLGKPNPDWSVAGITGILQGQLQEILFQEKSTGKAFAWTLDADLNVTGSVDLEIGTHTGLRVHLAEL